MAWPNAGSPPREPTVTSRKQSDERGKNAQEEEPDRSSSLAPAPRAFVEALKRAGIKFRVSYEQPDGETPIYIAAPLEAVRGLVPEGGTIDGSAVRFWDDWVIAFCDSSHV